MLTEQEKKAIEDCVTRPISVWEGIKSIITAEKYTWYLESLARVHIVPNIAERKAKWDRKNAEARSDYMETDDYDEDLKKVLQQVANVLSGFNVASRQDAPTTPACCLPLIHQIYPSASIPTTPGQKASFIRQLFKPWNAPSAARLSHRPTKALQ